LMKLRLVEKRENPFLDRIEYVLEIDHWAAGTPSRRELANRIVEELKVEPEKTVLLEIVTETGMNRSRAVVYYYPRGMDLSQLAPFHRNKVLANYLRESEGKEGGESEG